LWLKALASYSASWVWRSRPQLPLATVHLPAASGPLGGVLGDVPIRRLQTPS
jgi:hypothetical protein